MAQVPPGLAKLAAEEVPCPPCGADSALETGACFIYYKLDPRGALQALARMFKQGSGVIYAATPE